MQILSNFWKGRYDMKPEYIVVQAGGKGTRLGYLTKNKPKALVPIDNLPMLFHLFWKYPNSKYIIIGDYKYDVLERYLAAFAKVDYQLVCASGHSGTCAGLGEAIEKVPEKTPFLLIWSDLILPEKLELPDEPEDYIGVAKDFPCRWKYENETFVQESSDEFGVAGMFLFQNSAFLNEVPKDGEFVRWLSGRNHKFGSLPLRNVKEYGLLSEYQKLETARCRPFNRTYVEGNLFVKEPIDAQGESLAVREAAWYRKVANQNFKNIPQIAEYQPLKMEYVEGKPVYEYQNLSHKEKTDILKEIIVCLKSVQMLETASVAYESVYEAYIGKTWNRLEKVKKLVPFAEREYLIVNGKRCRNVFYCKEIIEKLCKQYIPLHFKLIHGDCTFSNIMLRGDGSPVLIDPRGYFGFTELYGDPAYDWAKLYYSIVGNYDQFNRKRFTLDIEEDAVKLEIESNGWEDMEEEFFCLIGDDVTVNQIHLLHAIIWLSLTTYAWEDYDSICGAFYNGLFYLEDAINETIL